MKIVVVLLLVTLSACSSVVTQNERFTRFVNQDYVLTQESMLYKGDCGWVGDFMLAAASQHSVCLGTKVKEYPIGTVIHVVKIIDQFGGSQGRCWRVQISISGQAYSSIDIPACHLWHPQSWITSSSPYTIAVLDFKPKFAVQKAPNP